MGRQNFVNSMMVKHSQCFRVILFWINSIEHSVLNRLLKISAGGPITFHFGLKLQFIVLTILDFISGFKFYFRLWRENSGNF